VLDSAAQYRCDELLKPALFAIHTTAEVGNDLCPCVALGLAVLAQALSLGGELLALVVRGHAGVANSLALGVVVQSEVLSHLQQVVSAVPALCAANRLQAAGRVPPAQCAHCNA
jgi:hypothetical protein